jgi:hypothetical protein
MLVWAGGKLCSERGTAQVHTSSNSDIFHVLLLTASEHMQGNEASHCKLLVGQLGRH